MYRVYCDGYLLHDPEGNDPAHLIVNGKVTKTVNRADGFTFTIYPQNENAGRICKMTSYIEVFQDEDETIFTGRPVSYQEGWDGQKTWQCEGFLAALNDTVLRPYSFNGTVRDYVTMLVSQHNAAVDADRQFTVRNVTVQAPGGTMRRWTSDYKTTMAELLEKTAGSDLGGYLVAETADGYNFLDYLSDSSASTGQGIEISKNLVDFKREQDGGAIVTALIPLGARDEETGENVTIASVNGGLDYLVDTDAAAEYGLIYATERWESISDPATLKERGQARLAELVQALPRVTLTAVDLHLVDQSIDPIRLMDYITVVDDEHQTSGRFLVTERVYNISAPESDRITFGGEQQTISGATARNRSYSAQAGEQAYSDARGAMENAIAHATEMITGANGGYLIDIFNSDNERTGLMIADSNDPQQAQNVWLWTAGGLGHSSTGMSGPFSDIALTADGWILGDRIYANSITAGKLDISDLYAIGAKIANFIIAQNSIYNGRTGMSDSSAGVYIGTDGISTSNIEVTGGEINLESTSEVDHSKLGIVSYGHLPDYPYTEYVNTSGLSSTGLYFERSDGFPAAWIGASFFTNTTFTPPKKYGAVKIGSGVEILFDDDQSATYSSFIALMRNPYGDLAETGKTATDKSTVSVARNSQTQLASVTLTDGVWLVTGYAKFEPGTAGTQRILLAAHGGSTSTPVNDSAMAQSDYQAQTSTLQFFTTITTAGTYDLMCNHSDSSSKSVTGELRAVQIA